MTRTASKMDPKWSSFKKEERYNEVFNTPNTWKSLMTGFDTPIMLDRPARKRKSGWFVGLTCLVSAALVLATTQLSTSHPLSLRQLQGYVLRSSVPKSAVETTPLEPAPRQLNSLSRTPDVQFDSFSLILKGQRIFL